MKYSETVPKIVIRLIGDTAYDSYISETLVPLKSAIKPRKQTRFAVNPMTSVKTIPTRRTTRSHPPKWTINTGDPDLLIPIELSQARADVNQDFRGNLYVVRPRESTTKNSIAQSRIDTPSQSEILSDNNTITTNTSSNISCSSTRTPSKEKYYLRQGQVQAPARM